MLDNTCRRTFASIIRLIIIHANKPQPCYEIPACAHAEEEGTNYLECYNDSDNFNVPGIRNMFYLF